MPETTSTDELIRRVAVSLGVTLAAAAQLVAEDKTLLEKAAELESPPQVDCETLPLPGEPKDK